jgi:hypothetical protein
MQKIADDRLSVDNFAKEVAYENLFSTATSYAKSGQRPHPLFSE